MISVSSQENNLPKLLALIRNGGPVVLCALAGFLSAFTVPIVGLLPVGELVFLLIFPWVVIRAFLCRGWPTRFQQLRWYKILFLSLGFMLLGYIVSDLYRGTSSDNFIRGWARVGFLVVDLVTIGYLIDGSWRRLYVLAFALYLGNIADAVISGPLAGEWWKFGVGYPLCALALFAVAGRATGWQLLVAAVMGALSLVLGSRNLGGICFLTAGLFWLRHTRGVLRLGALAVTLGALAVMFVEANTVVLENQNHEGSNVERESMIETAAEAFLDSPLIGQGTWFTASRLMNRLEQKIASKDVTFHGFTEEEARGITIHSQLLISLAEGGILGGAFFLGMGLLLLKTLGTLVTQPMPHRAFLFYIVIGAIWDLCMSPFSGVARVQIVLSVCTCLLVVLQRRGELSDDFSE
jgi:hypothetical protein